MNSKDTTPPASTFSTPIDDRYFEDYVPGDVHRFGEMRVTEQEIIEFARRYDPQDFHTDPAKAADTQFGGLIASGWMTGSVVMRMLVDNFVPRHAGLGSPGMDEVRWLKPVRPGDRLRVRVTIAETRRSRSKPDRGSVLVQQEAINQNGEVVMTIKSWGMYLCRDPKGA